MWRPLTTWWAPFEVLGGRFVFEGLCCAGFNTCGCPANAVKARGSNCWLSCGFTSLCLTPITLEATVVENLNGLHDLHLEPLFIGNDDRGSAVCGVSRSAVRWPILDGVLWVVVGLRSKRVR